MVIASGKAYAWRGNYDGRLQLEREQLHSQEEQKREAGREKRRDELERDKKAASKEHEAAFGAIFDSREASLRAPQGSYFRTVGFMSSGVPEGRTIVVGAVFGVDSSRSQAEVLDGSCFGCHGAVAKGKQLTAKDVIHKGSCVKCHKAEVA